MLGELIEEAPTAYQEVDGQRAPVSARFVLLDPPSPIHNPAVGFEVATYDPTLPLVIDPELAYASYLGGSGNDRGKSIAVDRDGNVYVTGETSSSDFPTTTNGIQPACGGGACDGFVTKIISASGVYTYGYSSYLGGSGNDIGRSIAVDSGGNVYVTGETSSSDFPATADALQPSQGSVAFSDGFVVQIVTNGGVYTYGYSSYLGGSAADGDYGIAVDGDGSVYVTGFTWSTDFPTTANALQPSHGGGNWDAFLTQIISAAAVYYCSYLGGSGWDRGYGIAVNDGGDAYVTGHTSSTDFPTTSNAIQSDQEGSSDAFVTQVISAGGVYTYSYSSYLGGSGADGSNGIAVGSDGNAYVVGSTWSTDFPTTANATQPGFGGVPDAFVSQIISVSGVYTGSYSFYLGGSGLDWGSSIALDNDGNAYVTGATSSTDFLITTDAIQWDNGGGYDTFVAIMLETNPAITVEKTASTGSTKVSETITYTYWITNTGEVTLDPVTAHDDRLGSVALGTTSLAPGAWTTGLLTYTVVAGDLPGPLINTVTVTGTPPVGSPVGGTAGESVSLTSSPAIAVSKTANVSSAQVGETITYTYRITNTGDVYLTGVVATDDRLGSVTLGTTALAPDAWTTGLLTYTVVAGDLPGPITNTVTVAGTPPVGSPVGDTAGESVALTSSPAITVTKIANVSSAQVGETITYTYRVTNTGNVDMTGVVASDDRLGSVTLGTTALAPDAWTTGVLTYTVVSGDLPGPLVNTVTVTGTPPVGSSVGGTDDESVALISHTIYLPLVLRNG